MRRSKPGNCTIFQLPGLREPKLYLVPRNKAQEISTTSKRLSTEKILAQAYVSIRSQDPQMLEFLIRRGSGIAVRHQSPRFSVVGCNRLGRVLMSGPEASILTDLGRRTCIQLRHFSATRSLSCGEASSTSFKADSNVSASISSGLKRTETMRVLRSWPCKISRKSLTSGDDGSGLISIT